jgi:tol-pal system protein YbgF
MVALIALLQGGCGGPATKNANTGSPDMERIEEEFVALKQEFEQNDPAAQKEIEALRTELQALIVAQDEGIEKLNDQTMNLGNRVALLSDQVEQLRKRIENLKPQATSPSPARKSQKKVPRQPPPSSSARKGLFRPDTYKIQVSYKAALQDYYDEKYKQAIGEFGEILAMAPRSDLADNAQYWIGECYYSLKNYRHALSEFQKVFAHAKTNKADAAQFKIALCYRELGDRANARAELRKLLRDYPRSEFRSKAQSELKTLGQ